MRTDYPDMKDRGKYLRQPCYTVLDWIVFSKACEASGMCAGCGYSNECKSVTLSARLSKPTEEGMGPW